MSVPEPEIVHVQHRLWPLLVLVLLTLTAPAQSLTLELFPPDDNGWFRLNINSPTTGVYRLEASTNLFDWNPIATTLDGLTAYPDVESTNDSSRCYRFLLTDKTNTNDWKNQIVFPQDPFLSIFTGSGSDELRWIKFAVVLSEPYKVYYQDSGEFLFHYDFAHQRLRPFLGISTIDFDQVSLHLAGQEVILGTVLQPPSPNEAEYGIQFVGLDPYPAETVKNLFNLVKATVVASPGVQPLYIPTFEQIEAATTNQEFFAAHGIEISSTARWLLDNQCYAPGWALGKLKFIPANEIDDAYADGRLNPQDILLTDGVPSEVPFFAGIISLTPSTPSSHVAILAKSYGIPFVYPVDPAMRTQLQGLVGRKIGLSVIDLFRGCVVRVLDLEGQLSPELEAEILDLKSIPELELTPKASFGVLSASTDTLTPADIQYFGGKAANFGLLRQSIPDNSPIAIAFSFDLWDEFLDQTLPAGHSLRTEINNRLAPFSYPPPIDEVRTNLNEIRDLIRNTATFTPAQKQSITSALSPFDPSRKIRFRSSTNVEDSEHFTGAGLYNSYSGCLLDDLDGDTVGPSHCDPGRDEERGVYRAMRRVYGSFYNENAFLERLRFGVDESTVGMGLLVHHSFPDDIELANGVSTLTSNPRGRMNGDLVTQIGAFPVTNPEGTAQPEVISTARYSFGTYLTPRQGSDLLPLGAHVLDWEADYRTLMDLFLLVSDSFSLAFPEKQQFLLDFEYKKIEPGELVVKQVREIPMPDVSQTFIPFLLHQSNCFSLYMGEYGDVFSNHRLKSLWSFQVRNQQLSPADLKTSFYTHANGELLEGTQLVNLNGPLSSFSNATHDAQGNYVHDSWTMGSGPDQRTFKLTSQYPTVVTSAESPLLTLEDLVLFLSVDYAVPVPALDYGGTPITVTNQAIRLTPCPEPADGDLLQHRDLGNGDLTIATSFYWPEAPLGPIAGYTAPLARWIETTITGLTSEPIVLLGYYSQTYRPEHHNFGEHFIFEPRLEPGISPVILSELEAANIQYLHILVGGAEPVIDILGLDNKFRKP